MIPLNVFIFSKDNPLLAFQATFTPCGRRLNFPCTHLWGKGIEGKGV